MLRSAWLRAGHATLRLLPRFFVLTLDDSDTATCNLVLFHNREDCLDLERIISVGGVPCDSEFVVCLCWLECAKEKTQQGATKPRSMKR